MIAAISYSGDFILDDGQLQRMKRQFPQVTFMDKKRDEWESFSIFHRNETRHRHEDGDSRFTLCAHIKKQTAFSHSSCSKTPYKDEPRLYLPVINIV